MNLRYLVLGVCLLLIPTSLQALENFGGPILPFVCPLGTVIPGVPGVCKCGNNVSFIRVGPPKGGNYILTPLTRMYQNGHVWRTGQWVAGQASFNYYCVISLFPVAVIPGKHIDFLGVSR